MALYSTGDVDGGYLLACMRVGAVVSVAISLEDYEAPTYGSTISLVTPCMRAARNIRGVTRAVQKTSAELCVHSGPIAAALAQLSPKHM